MDLHIGDSTIHTKQKNTPTVEHVSSTSMNLHETD